MKTAVLTFAAIWGLIPMQAQDSLTVSKTPENLTVNEFRVRLETPLWSLDTTWADTADWQFASVFPIANMEPPPAWRIDDKAAERFLLLPMSTTSDTGWTVTWSRGGLDSLNWNSSAGSCYPPLRGEAFVGFLAQVIQEPFERTRIDKIELWAESECLTAPQLRQLLLSIASEDGRFTLLRSLLSSCSATNQVNIDGLFILSSMARKAENILAE